MNKNPSTLVTQTPDTQRRHLIHFTLATAALMVAGSPRHAWAFGLSDLSQADAGAGVRGALEQGANIAVKLLGKQDGFWGNDAVRILLPDWMQKAEKGLKLLGRGKDIDALKLGINRAAEQAVPASIDLLKGAVKSMTLQDAKSLLSGRDNSVTTFFKDKTRDPLTDKFMPIVTDVTGRIGLANQYNQMSDKITQTGLVKVRPEQATVERHVTTKALDGLYYMIGEEEKKIRTNPAGAGSEILTRVFGSLRR